MGINSVSLAPVMFGVFYFIVGVELMNQFVTADTNKTAAIVVKLSENVFGSGSTVWMEKFYNSPELALFRKLKKGRC
jgi:hypothetical protein